VPDLPFAVLPVVEMLVRPTPARPPCPSVARAATYGACPGPSVATHSTVAASSSACTYMTDGTAAHTADTDCDRAGAR
jgi:hypothetical protein